MQRLPRLAVLVGLLALHVVLYFAVNTASGARPESALFDFTIPLDDRIPFLPWTWVFYYAGYLYILGFAGWVLFQLSPRMFRRASVCYAGMILVAAIVQYALPSRAPWPEEFTVAQTLGHRATGMHPFATLPSMHAALSVFPAALSMSVLERPSARVASVVAASLIVISTLTLKEHYFLDAVTGTLLGLSSYLFWRAAGHPNAASGVADK